MNFRPRTSGLNWHTGLPTLGVHIVAKKQQTAPEFEVAPAYVSPHTERKYNFQPFAHGIYRSPRHMPTNGYTQDCEVRSTSCCGIKDLYGIDYGWKSEEMLALIVEQYTTSSTYGYVNGEFQERMFQKLEAFIPACRPYFIISSGKGKLKAMVDLIEELELGEVTAFGPKVNPTGSKKLEMAVYEPDKKALLAWYKEKVKEREKAEEKMEKAA